MANCTQIFVEGDGDVKFISDYIKHIKSNMEVKITKKESKVYNNGTLIATINGLTGWNDINNMVSKITQHKDSNENVLVIFDADTKDNGGGFAKRKKEIEDYGLALNEIFLLPNNKDDGTLEDLLENIINQTNQPIFDCWNSFEDCLQECASKKMERKLTIPAKKSKIYVYLEALRGKTKKEKEMIKDPNREYKVTEHWNLDAEYLMPLKNFLEKYLK